MEHVWFKTRGIKTLNIAIIFWDCNCILIKTHIKNKLIEEKEKEAAVEMLPNSFKEASITLIPKPDKDIKERKSSD